MSFKEMRDSFRDVSLPWFITLFGALCTLASVWQGHYFVESFSTFIYGVLSVYLGGEAYDGRLQWTRTALLVAWIMVFLTRYMAWFEQLHLWKA